MNLYILFFNGVWNFFTLLVAYAKKVQVIILANIFPFIHGDIRLKLNV